MRLLSIGAAVIPFGLGKIAQSLIGAAKAEDTATNLAYAQTMYQRYAVDLQELATIKKQLLAEYLASGEKPVLIGTTGQTPTNEANTGNNSTLYLVLAGIAVLFLLALYAKNKRTKRR